MSAVDVICVKIALYLLSINLYLKYISSSSLAAINDDNFASNTLCSHLSSVGRALVAERYGVAYRLDGLDSTNSNLRSRCVVLHGWEYTTSRPIWPIATTGSFGCPVLSRPMMKRVDALLREQQNVVLETFI